MATVVVIEHEFQRRTEAMVYAFAERWQAGGHSVLYHRGPSAPPPGDIAILHVDLTAIPPDYAALLGRYPRVVNGQVLDISKSRFSTLRLRREDPYEGPVIVKTEANYFGLPEWFAYSSAARAGRVGPRPAPPPFKQYPIYRARAEVPSAIWAAPGMLVERFLPERDERGLFCLRVWTFFGDRERCVLWRSREPIVKATNTLERTPIPVPEGLRAKRRSLGFDFGKFDYIEHEGREVLLDVNRTPSFPRSGAPNLVAAADDLAQGLRHFLPREDRARA